MRKSTHLASNPAPGEGDAMSQGTSCDSMQGKPGCPSQVAYHQVAAACLSSLYIPSSLAGHQAHESPGKEGIIEEQCHDASHGYEFEA